MTLDDNGEHLDEFTSTPPTQDGWYDVMWEPGDPPVRVFLSATPPGLVWGRDETDDPEAVELDVPRPELIQYRGVPRSGT